MDGRTDGQMHLLGLHLW